MVMETSERVPTKALQVLREGVAQLTSSQAWKSALEIRSRLHQYSFNNTWLIYLQRPTATMVAGYTTWPKLGRFVRKGEKGIAILAPIKRKVKDDKSGEEVVKTVGFKTAHVFDVSQTEGEPIPDIAPKILEGDTPLIRQTLRELEAYAEKQGWRVVREELSSGVRGYFRYSDKRIGLDAALPPFQQLKTLLHELAHGLMHVPGDHSERSTKELEAESTAFLLCHSLGLDTGQYTFSYLAHWMDDPEQLIDAGDRAIACADEILAQLTAYRRTDLYPTSGAQVGSGLKGDQPRDQRAAL
jgi:antirestriction protein ArdC